MGTSRMTVVSNNLHRFKSLGLCIPSEGAHSFFEVFSQSIPLLQRLTISDRGYSTFAFPPEFLGGSAPNLRHMKLTVSSYIPWDSGLFSILTTLEVHGRSGKEPNDAGPPSLDLLLSALARMPELEIVILHHCFPPPMLTTTLHTDVNLPNLKRLEVVAPLTRCTDFLRQMSINANAIVLLNIKCSSILRGRSRSFLRSSHPIFIRPTHLSLRRSNSRGGTTTTSKSTYGLSNKTQNPRDLRTLALSSYSTGTGLILGAYALWIWRGPPLWPLRHFSSARSAFRANALLGGMLRSGASSRS
ncbi:hypothetical protein BD779DRAFT_1038982 [Infundibulicybe gibba]|nr:hypothetical protein BD779DRAFT_1038982 [Infundibulicybe gibba]